MSLMTEGSVVFRIMHDHADWQVNSNRYRFGPFSAHGIIVGVVKNPNRSLEISTSGPLYRTTVFKPVVQLSITTQPDLHVGITWKYPKIKLYLNGQFNDEVDVKPPSATVAIPLTIESPEDIISLETIGLIFENLSTVFNTISAFLDTSDAASLKSTILFGLDRSKFGLRQSSTGSFKGTLTGTENVFRFAQEKFVLFWSIFSEKANRLAEAKVSQEEAAAEIAREKVSQERLKTIETGMRVVVSIREELANSRGDLTPDEKTQILEEHFTAPMQKVAEILTDKQISITMNPVEKK